MTKGNEWRETKNVVEIGRPVLAKAPNASGQGTNTEALYYKHEWPHLTKWCDWVFRSTWSLRPKPLPPRAQYSGLQQKEVVAHRSSTLGCGSISLRDKSLKTASGSEKKIVIAPTKTFKGGHRLHQTWIKINIVQRLVVKPGLTFVHKNGWSRSLVALPSGLETFSALANIAPDRTNWTLWPRNEHHSVDKKNLDSLNTAIICQRFLSDVAFFLFPTRNRMKICWAKK